MKDKKKKLKKELQEIKLIDLLQMKLNHLGELSRDNFSDNSAQWLTLRIEDKNLGILFMPNGNDIYKIMVTKDIVKVVDEETIFTTKNIEP